MKLGYKMKPYLHNICVFVLFIDLYKYLYNCCSAIARKLIGRKGAIDQLFEYTRPITTEKNAIQNLSSRGARLCPLATVLNY